MSEHFASILRRLESPPPREEEEELEEEEEEEEEEEAEEEVPEAEPMEDISDVLNAIEARTAEDEEEDEEADEPISDEDEEEEEDDDISPSVMLRNPFLINPNATPSAAVRPERMVVPKPILKRKPESSAEPPAKRVHSAEEPVPDGHVMCPVCHEHAPRGEMFKVCVNEHLMCFLCLHKMEPRYRNCPVCRGAAGNNVMYFTHVGPNGRHVVPLLLSVDETLKYVSPIHPVFDRHGEKKASSFVCRCLDQWRYYEAFDLRAMAAQRGRTHAYGAREGHEFMFEFRGATARLRFDSGMMPTPNLHINCKGVRGTVGLLVSDDGGKLDLVTNRTRSSGKTRRQVPLEDLVSALRFAQEVFDELREKRKK